MPWPTNPAASLLAIWVLSQVFLYFARAPMHRAFRALARLTGGAFRTPSDALVGPVADRAIRSLNLDLLFLGVHGMDPQAGFTTPNMAEAETNSDAQQPGMEQQPCQQAHCHAC